ncbi:hypothetical protein PanWU01x14_232050, partial [Parasponia andersonii]
MRRIRSAEFLPFDPVIERTLREIRRRRNQGVNPQVAMGDQDNARTLRDFAVSIMDGF